MLRVLFLLLLQHIPVQMTTENASRVQALGRLFSPLSQVNITVKATDTEHMIDYSNKGQEAPIPAERRGPVTEVHSYSHESVGHPLVGDIANVCCLMPTDLGKSII